MACRRILHAAEDIGRRHLVVTLLIRSEPIGKIPLLVEDLVLVGSLDVADPVLAVRYGPHDALGDFLWQRVFSLINVKGFLQSPKLGSELVLCVIDLAQDFVLKEILVEDLRGLFAKVRRLLMHLFIELLNGADTQAQEVRLPSRGHILDHGSH